MYYFDNSATTKCYLQAMDIMTKYNCEEYYNPSALYGKSIAVARDIKAARVSIASLLGAKDKEIVFTSSGSESDNMVFQGISPPKNGRVIISAIEHSAVTSAAARLALRGVDLCICPVDKHGRLDIEEFKKLLTPTTYLVSIIHVSNETGAINDIRLIASIIKKQAPKAIFHSDGVQAVGKIKVNLSYLGVDAYSFSAHKFHGTKGVGGIYIKETARIQPFIVGGGQERNMRSSTENTGGIIAMSYALNRCIKEFNYDDIRAKRDRIAASILDIDSRIIINTDLEQSAPHILSIAMPYSRSEVLVHLMESDNVLVGTGSACSSSNKHKNISSILKLDKKYDMGLLRISLSQENSDQDVDRLLESFRKNYIYLCDKLR